MEARASHSRIHFLPQASGCAAGLIVDSTLGLAVESVSREEVHCRLLVMGLKTRPSTEGWSQT